MQDKALLHFSLWFSMFIDYVPSVCCIENRFHSNIYHSISSYYIKSNKAKRSVFRIANLMFFRFILLNDQSKLLDYQSRLLDYIKSLLNDQSNLLDYTKLLINYQFKLLDYTKSLINYQSRLLDYTKSLVNNQSKLLDDQSSLLDYKFILFEEKTKNSIHNYTSNNFNTLYL